MTINAYTKVVFCHSTLEIMRKYDDNLSQDGTFTPDS